MTTDLAHDPDSIVAAVLATPYARILRKDEDGSYAAEVLEFPGCFAAGKSPNAATKALEQAMDGWVRSELEQGHDIPPPLDVQQYSGRVTLRLPPSVHERAAFWAAVEGVSLNRLLATAVAAYTGERPGVQAAPGGVWSSGRHTFYGSGPFEARMRIGEEPGSAEPR